MKFTNFYLETVLFEKFNKNEQIIYNMVQVKKILPYFSDFFGFKDVSSFTLSPIGNSIMGLFNKIAKMKLGVNSELDVNTEKLQDDEVVKDIIRSMEQDEVVTSIMK